MIIIVTATTDASAIIQQLAEEIWWPTYSAILSKEQLRYMLDYIYDEKSIKQEIENNTQTYLLVLENNIPIGFASFSPRSENPEVYKLHKIYCLTTTKGKGYGKMLLQEVEKRVLLAGKNVLELNVNKYNSAKGFYEKMGFDIIYEEDIPIGEYWMNDFVMRKELK